MGERSVIQVPLADLAEIDRGISWDISQERSEFSVDSLPVLRIPNVKSTLTTDDLVYLKVPGLSSVERWIARPGSVIMVGSNGNASRVGNVAFIEEGREFLFASFLFGIRPSARIHPHYLYHYLASPRIQDEITRSVQGTTGLKNLSKSYVKNLPIPVPSLPEQVRIAEILDTVDEAIQSTERVIAKLEQAKQGLLYDLLTHGGSVSRLGVLEPWPMAHLRDLYVEHPRNGLYKPPRFHGAGAPMVQMGQLFRGLSLDASDAPRVKVSASELERFGLKRGDLLFGRRSLVLEGAGKCAVVDCVVEPMTFESSLIRVRIDSSRLSPSIAALILSTPEAARDRMRYVRQVAVSGVTSDDVGNFVIPVPPIAEQRRIEEILRTQQSRIEIAREESAKLRPLKRGLMDDLLTGRVRVGASE